MKTSSILRLMVVIIGLIVLTMPTKSMATESINIYSVYVNRGSDSATITWKTDPETKGRIEYADATAAWQSTPWQEGYTQEHSMTLLNLISNATYIFRISAESRNSELKTKTDSFTTISEQVLGTQQNLPQNDPSTSVTFNSVLTPQPTYAYSNGYQNVLGQQNLSQVPYIQNIIPLAFNQPTNVPEPTATTTPTPTIAPFGGLLANNSTNLVIGIMAGLIIAALGYQFMFREEQVPMQRRSRAKLDIQDEPARPKKYHFNLGNKPPRSHPRVDPKLVRVSKAIS